MTDSRAPRFPSATVGLAAASLLLSFALPHGALRSSLVLERAALLRGEIWRLWSGHLIHDHPAHALWNLTAFAALGVWLERRERARFALALLLAAPLSGAAVVALRPDLASYQGASALASALYVLGAVCLMREERDGPARWGGWLALALFAAKLALEAAGRWPSPALPPGLESVTVAHLVGGGAGALAALPCHGGPAGTGLPCGASVGPLGRLRRLGRTSRLAR